MDAINGGVRDAIAVHDKLYQAAQQSRWFQNKDANVFQPGTSTRGDVIDYEVIMRDEVWACRKILGALTDAEAKHVIVPARAKDYWQANQSCYEDQTEQMQLLLENWAEWLPNGFRPDSPTLKPWQKEVVRWQQKLEADAKNALELRKTLVQP